MSFEYRITDEGTVLLVLPAARTVINLTESGAFGHLGSVWAPHRYYDCGDDPCGCGVLFTIEEAS